YTFEKLTLSKPLSEEDIENHVLKEDAIDIDSKTVLARKYDPLTPAILDQMRDAGFKTVDTVNAGWDGGIFLQTVRLADTARTDDALKDSYHRLRPGDPATPSNARQLLRRLFFDPKRYDLGRVGRHKINQKLDLKGKVQEDLRVLDKVDVVEA